MSSAVRSQAMFMILCSCKDTPTVEHVVWYELDIDEAQYVRGQWATYFAKWLNFRVAPADNHF